MSPVELEAEVRRLAEYLRGEGFKVYDVGVHARTCTAGMGELEGIGYEGMRSRIKRSRPPFPVKVGGRNTFRIADHVMLREFSEAA